MNGDVSELLFVPSAPDRHPCRHGGELLYSFPALDEMHSKDEWFEVFRKVVVEAMFARRGAKKLEDEAALRVGAAPLSGGYGGLAGAAAAGSRIAVVAFVPRAAAGAMATVDGSIWIVCQQRRREGSPDLGKAVVASSAEVMKGDFAVGSPDGEVVVLRRLQVEHAAGFLAEDAGKGKAFTPRGDGAAAATPPRGPAPGGAPAPGVSPQAVSATVGAWVCSVRYDEQGKRRINFADASSMLEDPAFDDWRKCQPWLASRSWLVELLFWKRPIKFEASEQSAGLERNSAAEAP